MQTETEKERQAVRPPASVLSPYETGREPTPHGKLDELALSQWRRSGVTPARVCSDGVFVRRAYLAIIGALPTAQEARDFILDGRTDKRVKLVDQLFQRPEYAEFWALRWGDVLRIKSEFPINLWPNAVQAYHRWVCAAIASNMRYDRFARALLTSSGSNFRVPPVNFYRAVQSRDPETLARAVALTFMGTRADRWPAARLRGMAVLFSQVSYKGTKEWKEEIVYFDPYKKVQSLKGVAPAFPDGKPARIPAGMDPREVFADWLVAPNNPWFARCIVNRVWYWLFGYGIIHEPDDIRPDNPPAMPEALSYLEKSFVQSGYDLRALIRTIATSAVFQLSPVPRSKSKSPAARFAAYPVRRLEAEVLIDAINKVTDSSETYSSPIPEPFTFVPESERSIALADGSITSQFLELFGRSARDTGLMAERNDAPSAAQRLHMINSSHIQRKLQDSTTLRNILRWSRQPRQAVTSLYLTILSRFPADEELRAAAEYMQSGGLSIERGLDVAWALINSAEFTHHH